jgi:hypothetical protein
MDPTSKKKDQMTDIEHRMLKLLDPETPCRPGWLGSELWADTSEVARMPQAYARPAGNVLNRLDNRGWASWVRRSDDWGWIITSAGLRRLARERSSR